MFELCDNCKIESNEVICPNCGLDKRLPMGGYDPELDEG